ncbi:MAG: acetoin utilization protein AcuC, partial [Kocuria sp.]|nr:acetoin utilization protein AcuC [Kocuria sp.]
YEGIHESSARLVGGSYQGAVDILDGKAVHAVNFGGGMHHAARDKASGFCVYNDCAVAIQHLLDNGVQRVVYIDVDGHHGDGTQSIFFDDPRVMTISLHETGLSLFPGTGFANEIGEGQSAGTSVNVAMPTRADDSQWLRAYDAVVPPLVREFRPEVIVSQHGCDSHFQDELTHLRVSIDGQRQIALGVSELADEVCEGRWIATGGGGYDCHDAVPRSWAHLVGIASARPVAVTTPIPQEWRNYMDEKYGGHAPEMMGDNVDLWWRSWEIGFDPNDETDRSIMATRKEVFPHWGLDPWYD